MMDPWEQGVFKHWDPGDDTHLSMTVRTPYQQPCMMEYWDYTQPIPPCMTIKWFFIPTELGYIPWRKTPDPWGKDWPPLEIVEHGPEHNAPSSSHKRTKDMQLSHPQFQAVLRLPGHSPTPHLQTHVQLRHWVAPLDRSFPGLLRSPLLRIPPETSHPAALAGDGDRSSRKGNSQWYRARPQSKAKTRLPLLLREPLDRQP